MFSVFKLNAREYLLSFVAISKRGTLKRIPGCWVNSHPILHRPLHRLRFETVCYPNRKAAPEWVIELQLNYVLGDQGEGIEKSREEIGKRCNITRVSGKLRHGPGVIFLKKVRGRCKFWGVVHNNINSWWIHTSSKAIIFVLSTNANESRVLIGPKDEKDLNPNLEQFARRNFQLNWYRTRPNDNSKRNMLGNC